MNKKFEDVIAEQGRLVYTNVGDSMNPVIREGDLLVIEAVKAPLKVGDVPLYKRNSGQYVLHRIVGIKNGKYSMKGDNRTSVETGIRDKHIIGVLTGIVRNGKTYPVETAQEYITRNAKDMIYLVSCAVNEETPDRERVGNLDLREIYRVAHEHMLSVAVAYALEKVMPQPRAFDQARKKAIRKLTLLETERMVITQEFEKAGIRYLPLKGIILKDDYPKSAMREMTDIDILCDPSRLSDVRRIMRSLDYFGGEYEKDHDVVYKKQPSIVVEIHTRLFDREYHPIYFDYYTKLWEKAKPIEGTEYGYRMTDEDFYVYLICHMYKHYRYAGTGLRSLLDIYVYLKKHGETLDRSYLATELEELELTDFEHKMSRLASKVFAEKALTVQEQAELEYLVGSGVFGTEERAMQYSMSKYFTEDKSRFSKVKYALHRVFISDKDMEKHYPFVYRHKVLYPLLPVYRLGKGIVKHPKRLLAEYKNVKHFKKKEKS